MKELWDYPQDVFDSIVNGEGAGILPRGTYDNLLKNVLHHKLETRTQYSGVGTAEVVVATSLEFLRRKGHKVDGCATYREACDIDPACRSLLASHEIASRPQHIYIDLMDRVPDHVRKILDRIDPHEASQHDIVEAAINAMVEVLDDPTCFPDDLKVPCSVCGRPCSLYMDNDPEDEHDDSTAAAACPAVKRQRLALPDVLRVCFAGTTCKDWSRRGVRAGLAGKSCKPFYVWLMERKKRRDHIIFQECTVDFPEVIIMKVLGGLYDIQTLVLGPDDMGWPVRRPRKFTICVLKSAMVRTVSLSTFKLLFSRKLCLEAAEVFFVASDAMVNSYIAEKAEKLGLVRGQDSTHT